MVETDLKSAPRVFVVDDDRGMLRLIEKRLMREGCQTAVAASGSEAIEWLSHNTADLLLLDLKLQDIEGKELINHLAAIGRSLPFIIITGQGDERVAVEMMKRGALDYLIKDVQFVEFVPVVVKRALAQVDKDRRLRQLEKEILEVSESEQRRIGRDLHDGVGQHLTALELLSQSLISKLKTAAPALVAPAQEIARQIRDTITQTRLLSHNLSPVPLEADGLMLALSELAEGTTAMSGITCTLTCAGKVLVADSNVATHLYRIAQEAVNNALKHSGAKEIQISLAADTGYLRMSIEDDGRGLPPERSGSTGLGLNMMRYRARLIGASLDIRSEPGDGMEIICALHNPDAPQQT
jgi:signal transduction histidine kinase